MLAGKWLTANISFCVMEANGSSNMLFDLEIWYRFSLAIIFSVSSKSAIIYMMMCPIYNREQSYIWVNRCRFPPFLWRLNKMS